MLCCVSRSEHWEFRENLNWRTSHIHTDGRHNSITIIAYSAKPPGLDVVFVPAKRQENAIEFIPFLEVWWYSGDWKFRLQRVHNTKYLYLQHILYIRFIRLKLALALKSGWNPFKCHLQFAERWMHWLWRIGMNYKNKCCICTDSIRFKITLRNYRVYAIAIPCNALFLNITTLPKYVGFRRRNHL